MTILPQSKLAVNNSEEIIPDIFAFPDDETCFVCGEPHGAFSCDGAVT